MADHAAPPEGWYQDPYGAHEARWFSDGHPTGLVRDESTEAHDPPPADLTVDALHPLELPEDDRPGDLLRADSQEAASASAEDLNREGDLPERTTGDAAFDVAGQAPA